MISIIVVTGVVLGISLYTLINGEGKKCVKEGVPQECPEEWAVNHSILQIVFACFVIANGIDGILNDNLYEIYFSIGVSALLTGFAVYRFFEAFTNEADDYILFLVLVVSQVFYFIVAYPLHQEFGWRVYRKVGSDKQIRVIYKRFLIFITLLKFDLMFALINILTSGKGVYNTGWNLALDIIAGVIMLLFFFLGWKGMKREIPWATAVFFGLSIIEPIYIVYNIIELSNSPRLSPDANYSEKAIAVLFIATACLFLVFRMLVMIFAVMVWRSYGKGLKDILLAKPYLKEKKVSIQDENDVIYDIQDTAEPPEWSLEDVITNTYAADVYVKM
jgi:hypothetical protein